MSTSTPEIVLLHAAFHSPAAYAKVRALLESQGFIVHIPELPTMNQDRPPTADLNTDTKYIRQYVSDLLDAGRFVAVLMHSYGGQVGTNALYGLDAQSRKEQGQPGGITRLIYMTAGAGQAGKSMIDVCKAHGHEKWIPIAYKIEEDGTCVDVDPKNRIIGPDISDEEADAYIALLKPWNSAGMFQPLENEAWRDIPVSYIFTTADPTMPNEYQHYMVDAIEKQGFSVDKYKIEGCHSPNLTNPEAVAKIVKEIVDAA